MLRKSKYSFLLDNNIIWHSLLGKSVKVSETTYQKLSKNKAFDKCDSFELQQLAAHKFISSEKTDNNVLQEAKSRILDSGVNNLFLVMTNKCNLACKYCFYQNSEHLHNDKMSFQTAKKAVDIFVKKQNKNEKSEGWFSQITFYGGEPLLNFACIQKITDYIEQLKHEDKLPLKTQLVINTNGLLINNDVVKWAKQHNIQVQISLDGDKTMHDKNRITASGIGSYDKVVNSLKLLVKNGVDVLPLITVTQDNLSNLPKTIYALCKKYKLRHYGMNLLIDLGKDPIGDYPEHAADKMIETHQKTLSIDAVDDVISAIFSVLDDFKIVKQSCGTSRKLTIFPDGKIFACQAISDCDEAVIGHVNTGISNVDNIAYWKNYTRFNNVECLQCKFIGFCGGGCAASALFRHHCLDGIDKHYCRWLKHIMDKYFNPEKYLIGDINAHC